MINAQALFFSVVNMGNANAVLDNALQYGAAGGMIFIGEGTMRSKVLERIGLAEIRKEILMISASLEMCNTLHEKLSADFKFHRRNKGIAFTIPFKRFGSHFNALDHDIESPYYCIIVIVNKGNARECVKAARDAGAKGGTLLHGTGSGIPTNFYFPLIIEPQKDILIIITSKEKVLPIKRNILNKLNVNNQKSDYIFTLPVINTSGLHENIYSERQRGVRI